MNYKIHIFYVHFINMSSTGLTDFIAYYINSNYNAYIGVGGTTMTGNYANNLSLRQQQQVYFLIKMQEHPRQLQI